MRKCCAVACRIFTLIEMLVVIAIIGILASMLMPSLQNALSIAQTSVCQNNLRQLGMGMSAYSEENGGWGTYSHYMNYLMGPIFTPQADHTLVPYLGESGIPTSSGGTLKNYDVLDVAICPAGRRDGTDGITASADNDLPNGSYGFSTFLVTGAASGSPRYGKITSVRRPSKRILCADVAGAGSSSRPNTLYNSGQFGYRHNEGNNICHVDNHITYYPYIESVDLGSGSYASPKGIWHDMQ